MLLVFYMTVDHKKWNSIFAHI